MRPSSRFGQVITGLLILAWLMGQGLAAPHRHDPGHEGEAAGFQTAAACTHADRAAHFEKGPGVHEACTVCALLHQAQAWAPVQPLHLGAREAGPAALLPVRSPACPLLRGVPGRGPPSC